jgi:hypothetical protein
MAALSALINIGVECLSRRFIHASAWKWNSANFVMKLSEKGFWGTRSVGYRA